MTPYFIDGKAAQGEDYASAIEALPSEADDPAEVCIETPDKRTLRVGNWPGGRFLAIDKRADGSEWFSSGLTKEQVKTLVVSFVNGGDWRAGLQWELGELAAKDARRRMLLILLVGSVLVGLALWWTGLFSG